MINVVIDERNLSPPRLRIIDHRTFLSFIRVTVQARACSANADNTCASRHSVPFTHNIHVLCPRRGHVRDVTRL